MTRRERMQARLDKREEWAAKRTAESDRRSSAASETVAGIPFGQPILVGHHSEKRHRRTLERADNHMRASVEAADMAQRHGDVAATLADRLDTNIFSDDADAIEQLEARIAKREAERDRKKLANAAWRKAGKPSPDAGADAWRPVAEKVGAETALLAARSLADQGRTDSGQWVPYSWAKPFDLTSLGANIRRDLERIEEVKRQQQRTVAAEEAGGVAIKRNAAANWCTVTFADKPERAIIEALRAAGYGWGGGSWNGYLNKLPAVVAALEFRP